MDAYHGRRMRAAAAIGDGVAVIPAARERLRSNDTEYEFRQNSDFYYLTGFEEPDAVLVIAPHCERERVVAFVRPRDRSKEIWTGRRMGVQDAPQRLGVDAAYAIDELDAKLPGLLYGARKLYYAFGEDEGFDRRIRDALAAAHAKTRRAGYAPDETANPGSILHEMRLVKDPDEIAKMRRAAQITGAGHRAGMQGTRSGMREFEIEALIEYEYLRVGATFAYPSIVAAGDNATILHYNTNRDELRDGDLLLVDSGCEFEMYTCDVTRTWPVSGRFTAEQRAIYEIVLAAQVAGIEQVRPGNSCRGFHHACTRVIVEGLIDIGLLKGSVDENVEKEHYRDYYMHGAGHWLGLDVHDAGRYRDAGDRHRALEAGMVTTVEPGIYVQRDLDCDERFKGIGVRIEDDISVTASGNENLTGSIPKTVAEIEAIAGAAAFA